VASRRVRYRTEALAEINMTNLIDVIVVILIIFIMVSNFVETSLNIKVPKVRYTDRTGKERIVAEVNSMGDFLLGGKKVTETDLVEGLKVLHEKFPEEALFVNADEQAIWGNVAKVVSIGKELQFAAVNLPARMDKK
jgi:biopolymer transport protein TolR